MKILIISHMYPSSADIIKGIFVHKQLEELVKKDYEVKVISPFPWTPFPVMYLKSKWRQYSKVPSQDKVGGIKVYHPRFLEFPKNVFLTRSGKRMFRWIRKSVDQIVESFQFDLVHCHAVIPDGYAGMLIAEKYKKPLVVTVHGLDFQRANLNNVRYRKELAEVLNFSEKIITVSKMLKELAEDKLSIGPEKFIVIPNGVGKDDITVARNDLIRNYEGRRVLLSVSYLINTKGIDINIRAVKRLRDKYPDILYLIVGDGLERDRLEDLVNRLDLQQNVKFLGLLTHNLAMEYMALCEIFSLPSWMEGFGVVYLEAMAHGKPAIACKGEGIDGVIEQGKTGMLVDPLDIDSLAETIDFLLAHREAAMRIGESAKELVLKEFTWEQCAERLSAVYEDTIDSTGG